MKSHWNIVYFSSIIVDKKDFLLIYVIMYLDNHYLRFTKLRSVNQEEKKSDRDNVDLPVIHAK